MLPKLDGLEVCKRLRATSSVPIIMLTARDDELDKVLGLELGADDYITKPFSIREFRSRVRALLRRAAIPGGRARRRGDDRARRPADRPVEAGRRRRRRAVQLTYVEFELLRTMAASPGRVFSREMLLQALWGGADYREPRTIDVHVRHLREKLERDPSEPEFILTVRGVGYRFGREGVRPQRRRPAQPRAAARGRDRARRRLPDVVPSLRDRADQHARHRTVEQIVGRSCGAGRPTRPVRPRLRGDRLTAERERASRAVNRIAPSPVVP